MTHVMHVTHVTHLTHVNIQTFEFLVPSSCLAFRHFCDMVSYWKEELLQAILVKIRTPAPVRVVNKTSYTARYV